MRLVTGIAAVATVVAGFAGSLTAAQALSIPNPLDANAPLELPLLEPVAGSTELSITYRADEMAAPVVMTLTCEPTGGDHPRAAAACDSLATASAGGDPFAAPAGDMACTQIYGGPQTAAVVGTRNGSAVNAQFSRVNGCEIARWDALEPVLSPTPPAPGG